MSASIETGDAGRGECPPARPPSATAGYSRRATYLQTICRHHVDGRRNDAEVGFIISYQKPHYTTVRLRTV